ncbi:hypothetical protein Plhal304r1_c021g0074101 [Plasmopara halstedii]
MELVKPITSDCLAYWGSYLVILRPPHLIVGHGTAVHDGEYFDSMAEAAPTKYRCVYCCCRVTFGDYCDPFCMIWLYSNQHKRPDGI